MSENDANGNGDGRFQPGTERTRELAVVAGLASGRARGRKGIDPDTLPPLDSIDAAKKWLEVAGKAVATGQFSPAMGNSLVKAAAEYVRACDVAELQRELRMLQDRLAAK